MYPKHHALLYIGQESFDLADYSREYKATHDIVVQEYKEFRIDDARNLINFATQTPMHNSQQVFVVVAETIAVEAQNALLKLIEEPPAVSSFVFVLSANTLLPTLRSRFMVVSKGETNHQVSAQFKEFLASGVPERLEIIATLIDKKDSEKIDELKFGLLNYLETKKPLLSTSDLRKSHWLLAQMNLRGASPKMLWEDVSFTLPVEV